MSTEDIEAIKQIIAECKDRDQNEATTRHRIIDVVLHDYLKWPRNRTATEEFIAPGYADYVLKKSNGDDMLFIEAKKEGVYFELPHAYTDHETCCYISISKLLSDANIKAAINQVRTYCFDTGCEHACITNGHEWIFFKTFEKGKKWDKSNAFVIRSLHFFVAEPIRAYNSFSFTSITEKLSLSSLLNASPSSDRPIYFPKDKINSYSHSISANKLAGTLRPIVNYYFGVISDNDTEFMDKCYVSQRDYQQTSDGMRTILHDSLTPYFAEYGVQQLDDTGKGGRIGGRITKNLKHSRRNEVLVLFGGKGSGKSTFLKRLLFHKTPRWLHDHAVIAIVDLLNVPEDRKLIRTHIWTNLVNQLDKDGILSDTRERLIELFKDRFKIASNQELFGLSHESERYNMKLNDLISRWKADHAYCAMCLIKYWEAKGCGAVIVVDNTDQYSSNIQDYCFSSAQEISDMLKCMTIISMREERFYNSKIHGLLDAFQNSGFHISSPRPSEVFRKRLEYTIFLLESPRRRGDRFGEIDSVHAAECTKYLRIILREFGSERSPLGSFLTACAHGDTRLSLDLFRSFVLSGYTNVDEMLASGHWVFQIHQVIKPVMIPTRYFYDEGFSNIPNIYQIRHARNGSHYTALRILRRLAKSTNAVNYSYVPISELLSYFIETFSMPDDFTANVDVLLKHGFVEASNRIDIYTENVDAVKITNYGLYMLKSLFSDMTYLDLVSTDCGLYSELAANSIIEDARIEFGMFMRRERLQRVKIRVERVGNFIEYLAEEESREKQSYSLGMPEEDMFTYKIKRAYEFDKERVLESARKQRH